MLLVPVAALLTSPLFGALLQGGPFAVTTTPTQFSTTIGQVQRIVFRAIPGYCGKLYVGNSSMNVSTLAGVFKVIYPNCDGGLSDEYSVEDRSYVDGIDGTQFYLAGENSGDVLAWEAYQTGTLGATNLSPTLYGPFSNTTDYATALGAYGSLAAVIQVSVVPGQTGKIHVGTIFMEANAQPDATLTGIIKILYPNNGSMNVSDSWTFYVPDGSNQNYIEHGTTIWPEVSSEFPTVVVWARS
jgi:hypothetical protein